jgi:hypothetical protein
MGLSTLRTLLPRTKTYSSHYFKIQKKLGLFLACERTYEKIFIQIEENLTAFLPCENSGSP